MYMWFIQFPHGEYFYASVCAEGNAARKEIEITFYLANVPDHHGALTAEASPEPQETPDENDPVGEDAEFGGMNEVQPPDTLCRTQIGGCDRFQ